MDEKLTLKDLSEGKGKRALNKDATKDSSAEKQELKKKVEESKAALNEILKK